MHEAGIWAGNGCEAAMRMLVVVNNPGVLAKPFFPTAIGPDHELSQYLCTLAGFRDEFTIFSVNV